MSVPVGGGLLAVAVTDLWLIGVVVVLIVISAVLALAETALTRMSKARAQALVDQGVRGAERVLEVVEHLERDLNAVFLALLAAQTVQAALTGVVAERLFGPWGVAVAILVNVIVVFVIAEAAPKTWALQHTDRAAVLAAPVVAMVGRALRLVARGLIGVTNVILPGKGLARGPFVTEEELIALAGEAAEAGGIEESERDLIESIIDFGDTVAREIMIPRTDMVAMADDFQVADVVEMAILNGLSRFPVYRGTVDDIVGIVYAKDLMRAERDGGGQRPVSDLMRSALFVPETKRVAELLGEMQAAKNHMAIVVDEYGGTAGLVTLEDLLEELVGEIHDEFDEETADFRRIGDDVVIVDDPSVNVDDLNDELDMTLPEGDWDSVGGLVFSLLGQAPAVGDVVEVEGYRLTVERVDGRRVARVRIVTVPVREPEASDRGA